jgi:8-oxo-dGTP diphosphatase
VRDASLHVLLATATGGPFAGAWALPGGLVRDAEPLDVAAARTLLDRTGLTDVYLEQLYTFGSPDRDPRRASCRSPTSGSSRTRALPGRVADDGADVGVVPVRRLPALAYDHATSCITAVARLRAKLQYTNLVYTLLPPRVHGVGAARGPTRRSSGAVSTAGTFRKKILSTGLLAALDRVRRGAHRPATLYRLPAPPADDRRDRLTNSGHDR